MWFSQKKIETVYGFEDGVCNFFVAWLEIRTVLIRIPVKHSYDQHQKQISNTFPDTISLIRYYFSQLLVFTIQNMYICYFTGALNVCMNTNIT